MSETRTEAREYIKARLRNLRSGRRHRMLVELSLDGTKQVRAVANAMLAARQRRLHYDQARWHGDQARFLIEAALRWETAPPIDTAIWHTVRAASAAFSAKPKLREGKS